MDNKIIICTTSQRELINHCTELAINVETVIWGRFLKDIDFQYDFTLILLKGSDNIPDYTKDQYKRRASKVIDLTNN